MAKIDARTILKNSIAENPDLILDEILEDPRLMARLVSRLGQSHGGTVVDIRTGLTNRLQAQVERVESGRLELIRSAQDFAYSVLDSMRVANLWLESPDLTHFLDQVNRDFHTHYALNFACMYLEHPDLVQPRQYHDILGLVVPGALEAYFDKKDPGENYIEQGLQTDIQLGEFKLVSQTGSQAIVPFTRLVAGQRAILVLRSTDSERYHAEFATDILIFWSRILQVQLDRWVEL